MVYRPSSTITDVFRDDATGYVNGDYTKRLYKNGVVNGATVTVTEIANDYYQVSFAVDSSDETTWALAIERDGKVWERSYVVQDADDYKADVSALATSAEISGLNDLSAAEVNAEVDTALSDYDGPTNTEMLAAFTEIKGATWASGTDTLEAIRDQGDAAWITATGFSSHDENDVVTAMQGVAGDFKADISALALEANVEGYVTSALSTYDPPTRAELTSDKTEIITEIDANETKIDALPTAAEINTAIEAGQIGTDATKIRKFVSNKLTTDNTSNTYVVYDDDATTPAFTGTQTTTERTPD